ncbi:AAA family ATPase [Agrobacterium rubi]|uniref:ATP-dependent nuclease n=1 Tax=Agrobacterium rubi TaxID=28099 RepID=UPI001574368F|nr:AAA family ATPase [Agrobacterium rubi]NTF10362.1 AAA family ATPase [Agrobacterium rubi]NTF21460.1 AAA family ATPase [Agrobacterium rubi]NTF28317.1 AAA family ATPase [Agrobacterium rubi]
MHISKLQLVNYRNFENADVIFKKGINTIIGENGSGKTNLFRAIRLLLDDSMLRSAIRLEEKDFHRGLPNWRGHWIIISLEFEDVSPDEAVQSLFLHGAGNIDDEVISKATYNLIFRPKAAVRNRFFQLNDGDQLGLAEIIKSITIDDYETVLTGKSTADFTDASVYKALVGDFETVRFNKELDPPEIGGRTPAIFSITKEVSFTFVQALRDVVSDFQNNRTNPLLTLLKSKSGEINSAEFGPIATKVKDLNTAIEGLTDVKEVRTDIRKTINETAGDAYSPSSLSIRSDLPDEADRLFQSLKLFVGEADDKDYEGAIHELSLGGANLIYLTLKLLEFKYQRVKQSFANFLLIEEPEAHIHTHIQKTLFDKLNYEDTQVIYSTHSSHISEVSNVEKVNILGRVNGRCEVFQPSTDLKPEEIGNIQRYLDAIRSNLLFAKSVILVEGDAEEILIPILVKKVLGVSLDELGVSLINIRSTGFENVSVLFHDRRIRKRCSIVTDLDAALAQPNPDPADPKAVTKAEKILNAQAIGLSRQATLLGLAKDNKWMRPFFAPHTFEVDFVDSGNAAKVVAITNDVYKDGPTIIKAKAELESKNIVDFGERVLTMANYKGKGWFAILLGKVIDHHTIIPGYIIDAIFFAHGQISTPVIANVLTYRLEVLEKDPIADSAAVDNMRELLNSFREGDLDFQTIRQLMLELFPADEINNILARL